MSSRSWAPKKKDVAKSALEAEREVPSFAPRDFAVQAREADSPATEDGPGDLYDAYLEQRRAQSRAAIRAGDEQSDVAEAVQAKPAALGGKSADEQATKVENAPPADLLETYLRQRRTARRVAEGAAGDGRRAASQRVRSRLALGPPGDRYEREAERVAGQVVEGQVGDGVRLRAASSVQRVSPDGAIPVGARVETAIQQARSGGRGLPEGLRGSMEQKFGADFSGVKVHVDARSDQISRSIQARAFTTGKDVFFKRGEYNPDNREGQELIAHELTHVVQQTGTGAASPSPQAVIQPASTAKRPLKGLPATLGVLHHAHIFFEDGKHPGNFGYGPGGFFVETDTGNYVADKTGLDDSIMRAAIRHVGSFGKYVLGTHDCQNYVQKILEVYDKMNSGQIEIELQDIGSPPLGDIVYYYNNVNNEYELEE